MAEWIVSYSGGKRTIRVGSRWHQYLTDSTWEVVAPAGSSYSPSGLGGCQDFWCKPVGELRDPQAQGWVRDYAREDGCVEFCGDSIAAGLVDPDGVKACAAPPLTFEQKLAMHEVVSNAGRYTSGLLEAMWQAAYGVEASDPNYCRHGYKKGRDFCPYCDKHTAGVRVPDGGRKE